MNFFLYYWRELRILNASYGFSVCLRDTLKYKQRRSGLFAERERLEDATEINLNEN